MDIKSRLDEIRSGLPESVRLVAISKFHPPSSIMEAYNAGQRIFGESRVQEMDEKHAVLPEDIQWHFIGHLQSNKIKYIVPYVALIHGVDSYKLLTEINKQAAKAGRVIDVLLQIHIAMEETKFGFGMDECTGMLTTGDWKTLPYIRICGLMGMASNTDDSEQVSREFSSLSRYFGETKEKFFPEDTFFNELSMGMSDDYPLAVEAGSTLVRIGSKIFGQRY